MNKESFKRDKNRSVFRKALKLQISPFSPDPFPFLLPFIKSNQIKSNQIMGNNRERHHPLSSPTNPSSSSSPVSVSDPNSLIGSASGSFKNQGFLSDFNANISHAEFGFSCPEFPPTQLAGTVDFYERHVFLCYKNPQVWPPRIESAEFDRLPRLLSAAVMTRKGDMKKNVGLCFMPTNCLIIVLHFHFLVFFLFSLFFNCPIGLALLFE